MPEVVVEAVVSGHTPDQVYETVSDFARYPDLVDTVMSVEVDPPLADGSVPSEWRVRFRNGILRWRELDWFDRRELAIRFEQTEGEFDVFRGDWRLEPAGDAVRLRFRAEFDFGVASLASIIDPVAIRVLTESMRTILAGLFGAGMVAFPAPTAALPAVSATASAAGPPP
jgi:ribosome-associated toxin RatA of RatAB toxin-antitoxin module